MFEPTKEQESIRRQARGLYDSGMCLVGEWCRQIPKLTMTKWKIWEQDEYFVNWWTELFPEHSGITLADLKALEFEANRTLMRGLLEGDIQATKIVIQMVNSAKDSRVIADKSMDEWFNAPQQTMNGWGQA